MRPAHSSPAPDRALVAQRRGGDARGVACQSAAASADHSVRAPDQGWLKGGSPEPATASREFDWISEILGFLRDDVLPYDDVLAERIARQAKRYVLVDEDLYRCGTNGILLKCISREDGDDLLVELHESECRCHLSSRTLVGKAFRRGFYWPTALEDVVDLVRRCKSCQFHSKQTHQPAQALQTIPISWPFAVLGLDILEPFPRATGGHEYLYVAVDKFTRWVEADPVVKIDKASAVKFIRGLVCRFGVPNRLITDHST